jgi:uncharacterized protein (TIGR02118 family)
MRAAIDCKGGNSDMFKCITMIRKKPGMSRQEFIDYYETQHAPLVRRLVPGIQIYRRNYVIAEDSIFSADKAGPGFDAMTEGLFNTRQEAEDFVARISNPEIARQIREDEVNFVADGSSNTYVVEVHQSPIP